MTPTRDKHTAPQPHQLDGMRRMLLAPLLAIVACLALGACYVEDDAVAEPTTEETSEEETPSEPSLELPTPTEGHAPGRVALRRLNRSEYNNTVRDLIGTRSRPADDFPADDTGHGFDNNAAVLSISPLHLELYERAASQLVDEIMQPPLEEPVALVVEAEDAAADVGRSVGGVAWVLWSNGTILATFDVPTAGRYRLTIRAWGDQGGDEPARMRVELDGNGVTTFDVAAERPRPQEYAVDVTLEPGLREVGIIFTNDFYRPEMGIDRNLIVDWVRVEGPIDLPPVEQAPRNRVVICEPEPNADRAQQDRCLRQIVDAFATRAFRRPVTDDELSRLMALADAAADRGHTYDGRLRLVLKAVLVSPKFLFRPELGLDVDGEARPLNPYELASRLSYFLWSSMPDDKLFELAASGELLREEVIEAQVRRMLDDPRAESLVDNFGGQWLYIRDVANVFPDRWVFPDFDDELRESMAEEMRQFFRTFIREDRNMTELFTGTDVFVDERLAEHYGIEHGGDGWERVWLDESHPRVGLLSQAGLLTVLSAPHRTSIVRRGKWVLEQLLCDGPPPPPPGVEGLPEDEGGPIEGTLRERFEQHRADPVCASCHATMDPIGFGLENYDGIGAWREHENGAALDVSGELPDGRSFEGAVELQRMLAEDEKFSRCVVEKTMTYALARGTTDRDEAVINEITSEFRASGHRFEDLAVAIATSDPFRFQMPDESAPEATE